MTEAETAKESDDLALSGTIVAGRYKVIKRLGAGGMGQVFLVQHVHTDERLALKALLDTVIKDTNALERFRREARTPARIDSDHVVRVTDADAAPELKGAPFLVMEYLRGEDLDGYCEKSGPLPPREVVNFLRQIARVLDKAHGLGIIHRDLKPENVFVTQREDGSAFIKILDFGIAKFTGGAAHDLVNKTATSPGEIFGTPLFMSPEQARGMSEEITRQTDIWAMGLLAQKMLSGEEYWTAQTLTALISQIVYEPMKKPSVRGAQLGPAYDEWFLKCCARDPKDRFASAGAAVVALAKAFDLPDAERFVPDAAPSVRLQIEDIVPPTSARAEKPLSKTDLQLATTGLAGRPSEPPRSKMTLAVIAAALLFGIGGVAFYVSHNASNASNASNAPNASNAQNGVSNGASDGDKRTAAATPTETAAIRPEATATSTAVAQSVAVVPAASATAAEARSTATASATLAGHPANVPPHPGKVPAGPVTTPPAATTTGPAVKPPPPPSNPLDSRE